MADRTPSFKTDEPIARGDAQAEGHDFIGDEFIPGAADDSDETSDTKHRLRKPLLLLAPLVILLGALFFYLHGGRYEVNDDAALQSGLVSVSPNVAGRVIAVEVRNNQHVKKGDVLFRIDPAPFEASLAQAEAQLASAKTDVGALRARYRQGQADLAAAHDKVTYATREAARQKELLAEGISSQAQYDQAVLALQNARASIQSTHQANESIEAQLAGNIDSPTVTQPGVRAAQAALDRAKLNLSYTVIHAAQDGIVTNVDQLQVGDYVEASKPVFTLAGTRIWVVSNYKEDQLRYMRLGQPATIKVDAYPDLVLKGHVESFSPGTGNTFSVLPAENATGNWVKVVQRLPVIIAIDSPPSDVALHSGLSVEVSVDTGHKRHLFGADTPPTSPARDGTHQASAQR